MKFLIYIPQLIFGGAEKVLVSFANDLVHRGHQVEVLGCPVLATDVAGVREQMTHGETGWIVENDAQAICEGLRRMLSDPALREKLRSSAGMSAVCSNEEKYRQLMTLCE